MVRDPLPVDVPSDAPAERDLVLIFHHRRTIRHPGRCPHQRACIGREEVVAHDPCAEQSNGRCRSAKACSAPGVAIVVGRSRLDRPFHEFVGDRIVDRIGRKIGTQRQIISDLVRDVVQEGCTCSAFDGSAQQGVAIGAVLIVSPRREQERAIGENLHGLIRFTLMSVHSLPAGAGFRLMLALATPKPIGFGGLGTSKACLVRVVP